MKRLFLAFFVIIAATFTYGCNYGGIVSLPEQIAIYQNMGFTNTPLTETLTVGDTTIKLNNLDQINNFLNEIKCNTSVTHAIVLYLPRKDTNKLDGLLFIYYFKNSSDAQTFYNVLQPKLQSNLTLYKSAVIQKGSGDIVYSSALNSHYYNKFISGLKK